MRNHFSPSRTLVNIKLEGALLVYEVQYTITAIIIAVPHTPAFTNKLRIYNCDSVYLISDDRSWSGSVDTSRMTFDLKYDTAARVTFDPGLMLLQSAHVARTCSPISCCVE